MQHSRVIVRNPGLRAQLSVVIRVKLLPPAGPALDAVLEPCPVRESRGRKLRLHPGAQHEDRRPRRGVAHWGHPGGPAQPALCSPSRTRSGPGPERSRPHPSARPGRPGAEPAAASRGRRRPGREAGAGPEQDRRRGTRARVRPGWDRSQGGPRVSSSQGPLPAAPATPRGSSPAGAPRLLAVPLARPSPNAPPAPVPGCGGEAHRAWRRAKAPPAGQMRQARPPLAPRHPPAAARTDPAPPSRPPARGTCSKKQKTKHKQSAKSTLTWFAALRLSFSCVIIGKTNKSSLTFICIAILEKFVEPMVPNTEVTHWKLVEFTGKGKVKDE
ncbi:basic proline-rich protein-like [Cavia porcellus]|uniref:basic proline-rich protein-like n=1 Tax=Cavia porcellus TaxID=10141 RepID=UPI002FE1C894